MQLKLSLLAAALLPLGLSATPVGVENGISAREDVNVFSRQRCQIIGGAEQVNCRLGPGTKYRKDTTLGRYSYWRFDCVKSGECITIRGKVNCPNNNNPHAIMAQQSAYILRLPNEILDIIFPLTAARWYWEGCDTALLLTCKRFYAICLPHLYRAIHFYVPPPTRAPATRIEQFHQTVKSQPALGRLCKKGSFSLVAYFDGRNHKRNLSIATELLCSLPNIRELRLHCDFSMPLVRPMVQTALRHMPLLSELKLHGSSHGPPLNLICKDLNHATLPRLYLVYPIVTAGSISKYFLPEASIPTSAVTSLEIMGFEHGPESLQRFLGWFKALTHITVRSSVYTSASWESILRVHRTSLISIDICDVEHRDNAPINFSDFTQLETLGINIYNLDCSPETASSTLLAPRLRHLEISCACRDELDELWRDIKRNSMDWMLRFIQLALKQGSALRTIHIDYKPALEWFDGRGIVEYPWDLLKEAKEVLQSQGITLYYADPPMTKKDFEQAIR
ncbi:predicted protein [Uncinocarpus reesii 1704]|uniref:F-box domain-containing protein n=1 Tax=Uncinocarpus reesii (strain UAMH 1704) TaxID=336963 RepID=C4JNV5_UNCRE|nr:uncharacterized protein UREG_04425 [Uncinocarpus reesii 1704]EEP79579.1 predicted protein [Uncinocarpus reesii 1704]